MYRLLIVDNERIVVDSLLNFFEKRPQSRVEAIGAYSAREALGCMERVKVDILLTDIRMPGIDGLQLQKEVASRWPWCRTIFLTGFSEFDYVLEAMRRGGMDYLLKTEGNQAIEDAVMHAADQLDLQLQADELLRHAQTAYENALPLLRQRLLCSLVNGWMHVPEDLEKIFEQQKLKLSHQKIWSVYLRFDEPLQAKALDLLILSIEQVARAFLSQNAQFEQILWNDQSLIWLVSYTNSETAKQSVFLRGTVEATQQQCADKLGVSLSACVSQDTVPWEKLPEMVQALKHRMNSLLRRNSSGDVLNGMLVTLTNSEPWETFLSGELRARLDRMDLVEAYLEGGNRFAYDQALNELLNALDDVPEALAADVRLESFHSLSAILLRQMNRWQLRERIAQSVDINLLILSADWQESADRLRAFADAVFEAKLKTGIERDYDLLKRIHWIVENNLGGDLSLLTLGEMEGVSPSYLARAYKSISGESLKGYISRKRMEKAQQLLRESAMLNREVGQAVGFYSEQSFNRFFKTMCLLTPQEYRQQNGKS